jgi:hypothetical protein
MTAINDRGLHDWHAAWIDAEVSRHEAQRQAEAVAE